MQVKISQPPAGNAADAVPPLTDKLVLEDNCAGTDGSVAVTEDNTGNVVFVLRKGRYYPEKQMMLKNSLLVGVGFLELANACDFAANIWNTIPVPTFALVLMILGGTVAIIIVGFAIRDALLSRKNIRGLVDERRYLRTHKSLHAETPLSHTVECLLDINFKELGTEFIDRLGMDVFMGFGALMVGTGTYMAIGGSNPAVFQASNLLSGYIGNVPCAAYGLANLVWSAYIWRRAYRHNRAGKRQLDNEFGPIKQMLNRRTRSVRLHSSLNGIVGIISGAASLITSTMWWGYPILVPCIIIAVLTNFMWRRRVGYSRPLAQHMHLLHITRDNLTSDLTHARRSLTQLEMSPKELFPALLTDPKSVPDVLDFFRSNNLLEYFFSLILNDAELGKRLFGAYGRDRISVSTEMLTSVQDDALKKRILTLAQKLAIKRAADNLVHRERYLLEMLGCSMCLSDIAYDNGKKDPHNRNRGVSQVLSATRGSV